jgi:hypothetical protein
LAISPTCSASKVENGRDSRTGIGVFPLEYDLADLYQRSRQEKKYNTEKSRTRRRLDWATDSIHMAKCGSSANRAIANVGKKMVKAIRMSSRIGDW